jgi:hypothetical protein
LNHVNLINNEFKYEYDENNGDIAIGTTGNLEFNFLGMIKHF